VDYDFPEDLVKLQSKFFRLEAAGEVTQELTDTAVKLSNHAWWDTFKGNRFEARMALRQLAQDEGKAPTPDSAG
jgi:hypothetical protein